MPTSILTAVRLSGSECRPLCRFSRKCIYTGMLLTLFEPRGQPSNLVSLSCSQPPGCLPTVQPNRVPVKQPCSDIRSGDGHRCPMSVVPRQCLSSIWPSLYRLSFLLTLTLSMKQRNEDNDTGTFVVTFLTRFLSSLSRLCGYSE